MNQQKRQKNRWKRIVNCGVAACIEMREVSCAAIGCVELRNANNPKKVLKFSEDEWKEFKKLVKSDGL